MRGKQIIKIDGRNYALETTFSGEVGIYRSRQIETTGHISGPAEEKFNMPFGHNVEEEMVVIIARKVDEPATLHTVEDIIARIRVMSKMVPVEQRAALELRLAQAEAEYTKAVNMILGIGEQALEAANRQTEKITMDIKGLK